MMLIYFIWILVVKQESPAQLTLNENVEQISNYLSSITTSTNITCSIYKQAFKSPITGTTRQMNIVLNTNYGYTKLYYFFEFYNAYFTPIQLTIKEGGQIIKTQILNSNNSINFCSQSCQHYYFNFISETGFNSPQEIFTLQVNTSTTFWVTNFKVFAQRCNSNCKVCTESGCQSCMPTFIQFLNQCRCQYPNYLQYNGQCITSCPAGYYNNWFICEPMMSMQKFLENDQPSLILSYNSQIRNIQNSINGVNFYGPIKFNEKVKYSFSQSFQSPQNIIFEALILLFNPQISQEIQVWFGEYQVSITNFADFYFNVLRTELTTCTLSEKCYRLTLYVSLQNISKINDIVIFSALDLNQENSAWAIQDIKIYSIIPIVQSCTKQIYQGNCVEECPLWTISNGIICKDYIDIYPFYSIVATHYFNESQIMSDLFKFPLNISNCCQNYNSKFLLGGYQIWSNQTFLFQMLANLNHYKLLIKFVVILIDVQSNGDGMLVNFGTIQKNITKNYPNAICSNSLGQIGCQTQEDLGKQYLDYFIEIQEEIYHSKQNLDLKFVCVSTTGNSYCAIQNMLILSIDCPLNCQQCKSSTECIQEPKDHIQVYSSCPQDHYYQVLGECKPCSIYCKTCIQGDYCLSCENDFELYGGNCIYKLNRVEKYSYFSQTTCHQTCSTCLNPFELKSDPKLMIVCTCDIQEKKILNLNLCICIDGYYMDENNSVQLCISCGSKCQICKSSLFCLSCYSDQNRILDDNKCVCKSGFSEFDNQQAICLQCVSSCKTCINSVDLCTSCFSSQFRTLSQQNTCVCQIGYYEDQNQICQKCNQLCENCENSYQCLTCDINQFRTLLNKNCECQEGYYEDQNKQCLECYYTCSKCNNSNKYNQCTLCPSTRIKSSNFQDQFECKCKIGYYDDFYLNCLSCLDYIDPPSNHYCYSKCGDQIIQWNEECDDGNLEQRDDCNQCYFLNSSCGNQYCQQCQFKQCIQCLDGYYLDSQNQCVQCSSSCVKCEKSKDNCTECKYLNQETNQCLLCLEEAGYLEINNQCLPVCGDGIKTNNENCDDGNIINGDGCNQYCQIEQGYQCEVECQKINYIQILLSESLQDQLYSSKRHISFTFNQLVKFQSEQKIKDLLQITELNQQNESQAIQNLEIQDLTDYSKELLYVSLQIEFDLNQSCYEPLMMVQLFNSNLFQDQDGFSVQQSQALITLKDYLQISDIMIESTEDSINLSCDILYVFLVLAILAFLFGGFEIFWNLLDTLQLICYLKYFNVTYPYNFFAEFDFIKNQFSLQALIENYVETSDAPPKFHDEGYSTVFLVNIISVITVFSTTTFTFLIIKLMRYFLFKITKSFSEDKILNQNKISIITFYFYKFTVILQNQFQRMLVDFRNALLRAFMTTVFDLNIAIFLQFKDVQRSHPILLASFLFSLLSFFIQIYVLSHGFKIVNSDSMILKQKNNLNNYGAFYEGIDLQKDKFNYNYNLIGILKKFAFVAFLVFFYNIPCFQIGFASILSLCQGLFLLLNKPLEDSNEQIKQTIGEIIFWVVQLLILIFGFNEENPFLNESSMEGFGWVIIVFLTLQILTQLIFDVKQHIIYLYSKYQIFKDFRKIFIKVFKKNTSNSTIFTTDSDNSFYQKINEISSDFNKNEAKPNIIAAKRKMVHFQLS